MQFLNLKKIIIPFFLFASLIAIFMSNAHATPDPVNVSWQVLNQAGNPVNGAWLEIYYSTSVNGPFVMVPADDPQTNTYVLDKIANPNVRRNPIVSGYWNPDHANGIALADVHVLQISNYYFYVKINYNGQLGYWPLATSTKPGDSNWAPVAASTPSRYAAEGNGIGSGPSNAFPAQLLPTPVIPVIPLGPLGAAASMIITSGLYLKLRKRKTKLQF